MNLSFPYFVPSFTFIFVHSPLGTGCRYHSASPSILRWWCSTVLAADLRSTLLMCTLLYTPWRVHSCAHRDVYTPVHTVAARSRLRWADHDDIVVPRAQSTRFVCRVCRPTICNRSTDVGLRTCYLSVRTVGGASDRHWLKARLINGLTYLLTNLHTYVIHSLWESAIFQ